VRFVDRAGETAVGSCFNSPQRTQPAFAKATAVIKIAKKENYPDCYFLNRFFGFSAFLAVIYFLAAR